MAARGQLRIFLLCLISDNLNHILHLKLYKNVDGDSGCHKKTTILHLYILFNMYNNVNIFWTSINPDAVMIELNIRLHQSLLSQYRHSHLETSVVFNGGLA